LGIGVKKLKEVVCLSVDYVNKKGGRPRHEVEEWIACTLGMRRLDLYLQFDRPVHKEELDQIREGISRLAEGEPLAYILGKAPFYGFEFEISPDVLIPRLETELLVEKALQSQGSTFVDVCTGSGCIGLTVKKLVPKSRVILIDICEKALEVAKKNAQKLSVDVEIMKGDLLAPFFPQKADCIVSNPPYLSSDEWREMDRCEPRIALDAGKSGLEIYERLLPQMKEALVSGGLGLFEIGTGQRESVIELIKKHEFISIECIQDLAGHDRLVSFETQVTPYSSLGAGCGK
jgi:release factor glutamine methyltransferase